MIRFIREDKYGSRLHDTYRMVEQRFPPDFERCFEECEIEIGGIYPLQSAQSMFDLCPICEECANSPSRIGPACDLCKECGGNPGYEVSKCVQDCLRRTRGYRPAGAKPGGTNKLTF